MGPISLSVVSNFYSFNTNRRLNRRTYAIIVPILKIILMIKFEVIKLVFLFFIRNGSRGLPVFCA